MCADYTNFGGWVTLPPPPFRCDGTQFYGFAFRPQNPAACQEFLDTVYNPVAGDRYFRFAQKGWLDQVLLFVVQSDIIAALTPPFSAQGGVPEIDIGFWLPVTIHSRADQSQLVAPYFAFVPVMLFVDSNYAVAVGREVMGYPKYQAGIVAPRSPGAPSAGPFTVTATAVQTFDPAAIARETTVLSLAAPLAASFYLDQQPGKIAELFARFLCSGIPLGPGDLAADPDFALFLEAFDGASLPVVYHKQFRSAETAPVAVSRQLLFGDLRMTKLRGAGLVFGDWALTLQALDSLPLVKQLGLGESQADGTLTLTSLVGLWADIDFVSGTGSPLA